MKPRCARMGGVSWLSGNVRRRATRPFGAEDHGVPCVKRLQRCIELRPANHGLAAPNALCGSKGPAGGADREMPTLRNPAGYSGHRPRLSLPWPPRPVGQRRLWHPQAFLFFAISNGGVGCHGPALNHSGEE